MCLSATCTCKNLVQKLRIVVWTNRWKILKKVPEIHFPNTPNTTGFLARWSPVGHKRLRLEAKKSFNFDRNPKRNSQRRLKKDARILIFSTYCCFLVDFWWKNFSNKCRFDEYCWGWEKLLKYVRHIYIPSFLFKNRN